MTRRKSLLNVKGKAWQKRESQRAEEEHRAAIQWRRRALYLATAMIAMSIIAVIVFYFVH